MNDICLHTQTGSSSLHLCVISTFYTGSGAGESALVDTMQQRHKRPRPDSPAPIADSTSDSTMPQIPPETAKTTAAAPAAAAATHAASETAATQTQDLPPLPLDANSKLGRAGAESEIFDSTAECKHDPDKWKEAMQGFKYWWIAQKTLLLLIASQTAKFCARSTELVFKALSFSYGWGDMDPTSHQLPNNVQRGKEPFVTVKQEDALKRAYVAAENEGLVVGLLRMTKEHQCDEYMKQQIGERNQDGDMFRRTDLRRFVLDGHGWKEPIGKKSCHVHVDMSIFRDTEAAGYAFRTPRKVHTIASAALYKPPVFEGQYDNMEDKALMQSKLLVILAAADNMRINHLVLTAFGCGGRCKNPPRVVAEMMLNAIKTYPIPTIEICVLDDDGGSNFEAFKDVFDKATWD